MQFSKLEVQNAYATFLAKPRWQRKKWKKPSNKVKTGVQRSALKGKCTPLLEQLALPQTSVDVKTNVAGVPKAALSAKPTQWNIDNSLPKLKHINMTRTRHLRRLPTRQQRATKQLHEVLLAQYTAQHPEEGVCSETLVQGCTVHKTCVPGPINTGFKYLCQLTMSERRAYLTRMILMSRPKRPRHPPKPDRGNKKALSELQAGVKKLAVPRIRPDLTSRQPNKVSPAALKATCSDHLAELAQHRLPRPPASVYDFKGNPILPPRMWDIEERRRVVASQRTLELATPKRTRAKAAEDVKDDPFRVRPNALTAVCSERLQQLAMPITRD